MAVHRLSRQSVTDDENRLKQSRAEAETLKERIEELKLRLNNGSLRGVEPPQKPFPPKLEIQRVLEDHCGKVYALDWGKKWSSLLSARCVMLCGDCHWTVPCRFAVAAALSVGFTYACETMSD